MKPKAYVKWSVIPLAVMLLSSLTVFVLGLWFIAIIVGVRAAWVLIAPKVVPLEFARRKT